MLSDCAKRRGGLDSCSMSSSSQTRLACPTPAGQIGDKSGGYPITYSQEFIQDGNMSETPGFQSPAPPEEPPTLNNSISLSAVGVMLLIAAIGILVMVSARDGHVSGMAVLIATGLIILLAGAVLIYAALTGKRAGWFLPFTIVGAILSLPILMGGIAMGAWAPRWDDPYMDNAFLYEEETNAIDDDPSEFANLSGRDSRTLDPQDASVIGDGESLLLDLTSIPEGDDLEFDVELEDSDLTVVVNCAQRLDVDMASWDETSYFEALAPMRGCADPNFETALHDWVESDFFESYPGPKRAKAANNFDFTLELEYGSSVRFVVLDQQSQPQTLEDAQSGATRSGKD